MPNQPSPQPSAPRKANASEALTPSDLSKEGWIRELHPSTCLIRQLGTLRPADDDAHLAAS